MEDSPEDRMTEWLDELTKLSENDDRTVVVFEPGELNEVAEIFSPPRIVTVARRRGISARWSFDRLVEKEPGTPWDLSRRSHQLAILKILEEEKPELIVGSPPCSHYSRIMALNWPKTPRHRRRAMM